jgi:hypothetical protein
MDRIDASYYRLNFERLRKLFLEVHELDIQQRDLARELEKVEKVAKSLKSFLRNDLSTFLDSELNKEFEGLLEYEHELAQKAQNQPYVEVFFDHAYERAEERNESEKFNKTQYFLKMMYQGGLNASPSELISAIKSTAKKDLYDKTLVYSILKKLKARGFLEKVGEQYQLTDIGVEFAKTIE